MSLIAPFTAKCYNDTINTSVDSEKVSYIREETLTN